MSLELDARLDRLEIMLVGHDWNYIFSDNQCVWDKGHESWQDIVLEITGLKSEFPLCILAVNALWAKYAQATVE